MSPSNDETTDTNTVSNDGMTIAQHLNNIQMAASSGHYHDHQTNEEYKEINQRLSYAR